MYTKKRFRAGLIALSILAILATALASTRTITTHAYAVDASLITWANARMGMPLVGVAAGNMGAYQIPNNYATTIKSGGHVAGVTETLGAIGTPIKFTSDWYSVKRGVANTVGAAPISHAAAETCMANLAPRMNWFYNYAPRPWAWVSYTVPLTNPQSLVAPFNDIGPSDPVPTGLRFIPMFLDVSHVNATELSYAQPFVDSSGFVMTMNEPYGEGNNTVAQVIAIWPQIQALTATNGARIVAPSIGWGFTTPQTWLSDFIAALATNGYHVDVLNYHNNVGCSTSGELQSAVTFQQAKLLDMHATYPTYPIMVTEYECLSTQDSAGQAFENDYDDQLVPWFEAQQWIIGYFHWPVGGDPTNTPSQGISTGSVCDTGGALTATGTNYDGYSHRIVYPGNGP